MEREHVGTENALKHSGRSHEKPLGFCTKGPKPMQAEDIGKKSDLPLISSCRATVSDVEIPLLPARRSHGYLFMPALMRMMSSSSLLFLSIPTLPIQLILPDALFSNGASSTTEPRCSGTKE